MPPSLHALRFRAERGEKAYKARDRIIEPVFGQIKDGFYTSTRRRLEAVKADMIAMPNY